MDEDPDVMEFEDDGRWMTALPNANAETTRKVGFFFDLKVYKFCRLSIEATGAKSRLAGPQTPMSRGNTE